MKCLKVASYLIRFILQMYNVASGMTECYTAKSDLFDNLWIYVWQADCHQFQTCLVILGSKAMIRMMILMLIPLKGMIESSRQNSWLMCRLSPWLLMTIAECKWVQLTVEFELPQGGGRKDWIWAEGSRQQGWPWNIHAPGDSLHKESKLSH